MHRYSELPPQSKKKPRGDDFEQFVKKGLVYGNVQSGKTANIAGVIAMYASCGCQLVIVLSGVTNNLRWQTQTRLVHDLKIGDKPRWKLLTPDKDRVIRGTEKIEAVLAGHDTAIGVFKKNSAALKSVIKYCKQISDRSIWNVNQVLIIDDECDQYSPNVKLRDEDGEEYEHSAMNALIVELMGIFRRVCYVGYTATPFATVLNELPGDETLYPKDFIYALETGAEYYGADKLFGREDSEDSDGEETLDAINDVEDDDIDNIRRGTQIVIPDSLKEAIDYFVAATACKYARGLKSHSSMLIHIDLRTAVHGAIETVVRQYVKSIKDGYGKDSSVASRFERIWNVEKGRNPSEKICRLFPGANAFDYSTPSIDEMQSEIALAIDRLEVIVDNSTRPVEERLTYDEDTPRVCIVIGGNTLSRGLTLEGLVVSYFGRASKTYDTLLQMGRWFGYRRGYEDISRLWMPMGLVSTFMFLASVENEIREEIEDHAFGLTPEQFALRIRVHPRMQITRALAMQSAVPSMISYSGTYAETLFINRSDINVINHNMDATRRFLDALDGDAPLHNGAFIYRDCDACRVIDYINDYSFAARNRDCRQESLVEYIKKTNSKGLLNKWAVMIKSNVSGESLQLSSKIKCNLIGRAQVNEEADMEECHVKVHSPKDFMLDIDTDTFKETERKSVTLDIQAAARQKYYADRGENVPGLLVIYPINKDSTPKNAENKRFKALDAAGHLVGLLFVFPIVKDRDLYQYMQIPLQVKETGDDESI